LIFPSGERVEGYVTADEITRRLGVPRVDTAAVRKE